MRIHGRAGVAYLGTNFGDAASPVAFLSEWAVEYKATLMDVTTIVDVQHIYVTGFPDSSGSFSGFYDSATAQSYAAAVDGLPRAMYLYPSMAVPGTFFSGMVLPDYNLGSGVSAAVALSVKWASSGPVTLVRGGTYPAVYAAVYA